MFFKNRTDAGQRLARIFISLGEDFSGWSVIGLARGGVIVAAPVAEALGLPLFPLCVDDLVIDEEILVATPLGSGCLWDNEGLGTFISEISAVQTPDLADFVRQIQAKQRLFDDGLPFSPASRVIVCDDGYVSGKTALTAIMSLRHVGVKEIILAIPVIPPRLKTQKFDFRLVTWRVSTLKDPSSGIFYFNFDDVPDEVVVQTIRSSRQGTFVS